MQIIFLIHHLGFIPFLFAGVYVEFYVVSSLLVQWFLPCLSYQDVTSFTGIFLFRPIKKWMNIKIYFIL